MPYVDRDSNGNVIAIYENAQYLGQEFVSGSPTLPSTPDVLGFVTACKVAVGGILGANALSAMYPMFLPAIQSAAWSDVQALILDAQAKGVINATQYAAFKAAATANYIPITLP